jgi:hypothetical protein
MFRWIQLASLSSLECGLFAMILTLFLSEDDRGGENDSF